MKVFAGIVTYNPDISGLEQNLRAILPQVEKTIVFDNGSSEVDKITRSIETIAGSSRACLIAHGRNAGMAKALNRICEEALKCGVSHVLFLDQDTIACDGLVEGLLGNMHEDVGIASPRIVDRNDVEEESYTGVTEELSRAITAGSLVNLHAWRAVGGYDEGLFVDWVDYEFCDNLRVRSYRIVRVNTVTVLHELGKKEFKGVGWTFSWSRGFYRAPIYRNERSLVRRYDLMRGHGYATYKYKKTSVWREEAWLTVVDILHNLMYEKKRLQFVKAAAQGFIDGRRAAKDGIRLKG
ncbi:MAG: glycosyltransferase [Atopobiaceae bacterium]|nr:glycosyltransferase [Atopobiaceae bacterium]